MEISNEVIDSIVNGIEKRLLLDLKQLSDSFLRNEEGIRKCALMAVASTIKTRYQLNLQLLSIANQIEEQIFPFNQELVYQRAMRDLMRVNFFPGKHLTRMYLELDKDNYEGIKY